MNVPNFISIVRILLLPFFIYYFQKGNWLVSAGILALSGFTDFLDGFIARKFGKITELGKILDPIADKLTQATVAVCMAFHQVVLIPLLSVFIIKEFTMLCGSLVLLRKGLRPTAAKWYGKIATAGFYVAMFSIVLLEAFSAFDYTVLMLILTAVSAALMIHALVRYIFLFFSIRASEH